MKDIPKFFAGADNDTIAYITRAIWHLQELTDVRPCERCGEPEASDKLRAIYGDRIDVSKMPVLCGGCVEYYARQSERECTTTLGYLRHVLTQLQTSGRSVMEYGLTAAHSYRGYYHDIAFGPARNITISAMLQEVEHSIDATFEGYKGGDYTMWEESHVWVAEYSDCGIPADLLVRYWRRQTPRYYDTHNLKQVDVKGEHCIGVTDMYREA
ncbi:MAG: hypothetical protein GY832_22250 [Chloroflexi bacterium]|nr:hypothetical protein [Chloroflexota bacterium]